MQLGVAEQGLARLAALTPAERGKVLADVGPALIVALRAVLGLHVPVPWPEQDLGLGSTHQRPMCAQICGEWPCRTVLAVEEALAALP